MTVPLENRYWLGFDLGGTKMQAGVFDSNWNMVTSKRKKTRGSEGEDSGVERLLTVIEKMLEEGAIPREHIAGIGLGVPGPLDLDAGVILESPNLGWKNVRLKEAIEKRFGSPAVILNDVDAGIFAEYRFGSAKGGRCVLGVFPGTGIGGGLVYEGRIFRGKKSSCLEIGHLPTVVEGSPCGCGRRGCLETVASRLAISAEAAKAAYRGQAPNLLKASGTDLANIRSGALASAIRDGDKIIERIVRDAARHLGRAIAGTVNLLLPDLIVLGGGLVEAIPKLYLEEVEDMLSRHVMPAYAKSYKLVTAELGDDAGVRGAAAWASETATAIAPAVAAVE